MKNPLLNQTARGFFYGDCLENLLFENLNFSTAIETLNQITAHQF
jgi:hypothetical protein